MPLKEDTPKNRNCLTNRSEYLQRKRRYLADFALNIKG